MIGGLFVVLAIKEIINALNRILVETAVETSLIDTVHRIYAAGEFVKQI